MFQISKILPSEKDLWTKVVIVPDFNIFTTSCTWHTNLSHFNPILRLWRHNIFIFLSSLVQFLSQFWVDNVTSLSQNFKILRSWFQKRIFHVKLPFTELHLSVTIGTWSTSLGPFWPNFGLMTSPREAELQYFVKAISEANSSLQSSIKYWFWYFCHPRYMIYNFGSFLCNL